MTPEPRKDLQASVRARLLNLAKERGEDLDLVLKRFGLERLLFRLSRSPHRDAYILKGAMLFELWLGRSHRTTKDLDLLDYGAMDIPRVEGVFRELCTLQVEPDGLDFLPDSVKGAIIREDNLYQGVRVTLQARLGVARIHLQVDIGFGDAVVPEKVQYPSLLGFPEPDLRAYPQAAMVAEKFHVMVVFGLANSRVKDYHDIWTILRTFRIPREALREAILATFARRRTPVPRELPDSLTMAFASDPQKQLQWKAFLRKTGVDPSLALENVTQELAESMSQILGWV